MECELMVQIGSEGSKKFEKIIMGEISGLLARVFSDFICDDAPVSQV
jgi:hypothetical protein